MFVVILKIIIFTFVLSKTLKLPDVLKTTLDAPPFSFLGSFSRNEPRPLSSYVDAANVNNLQFTSIIFVSSSSPVTVSTSSYFLFCARLSSYSRATSVKLLLFVSFGCWFSLPGIVFCTTLENNNPDDVLSSFPDFSESILLSDVDIVFCTAS